MNKKTSISLLLSTLLISGFSLLSPSDILYATEENLSDKTHLNVQNLYNDNDKKIPVYSEIIGYSREHRPSTYMKPSYITIHNTDNEEYGADAAMHSLYLNSSSSDDRYVSWHFTVDNNEIYQHLPLNEVGYHSGDGGNKTGNSSSIAIEICENEDGNYKQAEDNATYLVARLLYEYDLSIDKVVPHKHWSGKECPRHLLHKTKESMGWDKFIDKIAINLVKLQNSDIESITINKGEATELAVFTSKFNNYNLSSRNNTLYLNEEKQFTIPFFSQKDYGLHYLQAVSLNYSDFPIDNNLKKEMMNLLRDDKVHVDIIGDTILNKNRQFDSPGFANLTFSTNKGSVSFDVYNYINKQASISSNVKAFIQLGKEKEIMVKHNGEIKWEIKDNKIAEIKNNKIIGKKKGETILVANIGDVKISSIIKVK